MTTRNKTIICIGVIAILLAAASMLFAKPTLKQHGPYDTYAPCPLVLSDIRIEMAAVSYLEADLFARHGFVEQANYYRQRASVTDKTDDLNPSQANCQETYYRDLRLVSSVWIFKYEQDKERFHE